MTIKAMGMAAAALALAACNQATPATTDTGAIKRQLQMAEAKWNQAYARRDAAALAAMYSDDAAIANPGDTLVRGRAAIDKATKSFAADPNLKVAFEANRIQVAQSGDLAYTRGHYTLTMTDPATRKPQMSTGNYLTVWQKQADGGWRAVEDFITPGPVAVSQGAQPIL